MEHNYLVASQQLVAQHLTLSHGPGEHHGVDAVEIGVGSVFGLLLDDLENEVFLGTRRMEEGGGQDQGEHHQQSQVDLRLDGHLPSWKGVVHGDP